MFLAGGYCVTRETELYYLQSRYYNPEWGRFISADIFVSTGQGMLGNNMFVYCNNNPVLLFDPNGNFGLIAGIILAGGVVGGLLGAFSAVTTGGNVAESVIEGVLTGALGSACGILISNPLVAVGVAVFGSAVIDVATQSTVQYIENGTVDVSQINRGRVTKTALQTGIGVLVPYLGDAAFNGIDALGTVLLWAEVSTILVCVDIAVTALVNETQKEVTTGSNRNYAFANTNGQRSFSVYR